MGIEEQETQEVDETTQTTETETDEALSIEEISPEDLKKLVKKLRTEAASRRVKNKELEEQARKWKEYEDSQKTELQRLSEERDALKTALETEKVERLRAEIVASTGLDPDLAGLLNGSEKEMRKTAEQLVERLGKKGASTDFYAGQRGRKTAPKAETFSDFMAQLWKEADSKASRTTL